MSWGLRRGPRLLILVVLALACVGITVPSASADVWFDDNPVQGWGVNGRVYATVIAGDTVIVGGTFTAAVSPTGTTVARKNLAAFSLSTGELLTGWKADAGSQVRALVTDGTSVWVGGSFGKIGGKTAGRIAKISVSNGAVDTLFSAAASVDNTVRALALNGSDLYAGGPFLNASGQARSRVAKFNAQTGTLDPTFKASPNGEVWGLAVNPNSPTLYMSGKFANVAGATRNGVAAVSSLDGGVQNVVFGSAAKPTLGLAMNTDGSMLYGAGGSGSNAAAAWNTTTGTRVWRQVTDGDIQAIAFYNNTVYFGFHDGYQGDPTLKLMAADANTGQLESFSPRFDEFWGTFAIAVGPNGLVAGGDFTQVAGVPAPGFSRFPVLASPRPDPVTQSFVNAQTTWSYWDQNSRPIDWQKFGFDDSTWATGGAQLGYGDGDEQTVISYGPDPTHRYITSYYRAHFNVTSIPTDRVELKLIADDGAAVYINGVLMQRDNVPDGTLTQTTLASTNRSGGPENAARPFSINPAQLNVGDNVIAVEVHQFSQTSDDVSFDAELTGYYQN